METETEYMRAETLEEMMQVVLLITKTRHPALKQGLIDALSSVTTSETAEFQRFCEAATAT